MAMMTSQITASHLGSGFLRPPCALCALLTGHAAGNGPGRNGACVSTAAPGGAQGQTPYGIPGGPQREDVVMRAGRKGAWPAGKDRCKADPVLTESPEKAHGRPDPAISRWKTAWCETDIWLSDCHGSEQRFRRQRPADIHTIEAARSLVKYRKGRRGAGVPCRCGWQRTGNKRRPVPFFRSTPL